MMKPAPLLSLHLVRAVLQSVGLVTLVLGGLYLTIQVIREIGDLTGDYGFFRMLAYLLRSFPTGLYDLFPFAVLIGSMIAAGRLSATRELIAMRANGFDRMQIAARMIVAAMTLSLLMMTVAEWWMPQLELQARTDREQARTGQISASAGREIWIRDANRIVRAEILLNDPALGIRFADIHIYQLGTDQRPELWLKAEYATHQNQQWVLEHASSLNLQTAEQSGIQTVVLESAINPDVFLAFSTRPRLLSMSDIRRISGYLEQNGLETSTYDEAFWRRLFYPLNILAMILVGLPLLFRADRQLVPAVSIFAGIAVGISFFVVWRIVIGLSSVLLLPLWLIHLLPALMFIALGYWRLRRN